jgi:hypothetical protein
MLPFGVTIPASCTAEVGYPGGIFEIFAVVLIKIQSSGGET